MAGYSILIFGDICPDNDYRQLFDSGKPFSEEIVQDIRNASLVIGNLECPATENGYPVQKTGPNQRARPQDLDLLSSIGFTVLSLANNHILDYGIPAVEETMEHAEECGIKTVGAGRNAEEAGKALILECNRKTVGILSFAEAEFNLATESAPGANHFDPYTSFEDVRELKEKVDYVIVLYHGGIENHPYPSPLLQKKCRKFAEQGADLILSQHSHCIGTLEKHAGGTILYGQGNCAFGYRAGNQAWNEGLAVLIDPGSGQVEFRLLQASKHGVVYAEEALQRERLEQLKRDSEHLKDEAWIRSEWSRFCQSRKALDLPLLYGWNRVLIRLNRIFGNRLIERRYSRRKQMITMNMIRCDALHEVVQTILEDTVFH